MILKFDKDHDYTHTFFLFILLLIHCLLSIYSTSSEHILIILFNNFIFDTFRQLKNVLSKVGYPQYMWVETELTARYQDVSLVKVTVTIGYIKSHL